ncbi:MAG: cell division protein ZapA [Oscillospiraceae bacterium]|nr:cell division protein ZapA [Oscillospiraceae bacterium]
MKNRVIVSIAGQEFALLTEEDEQYVQRVADRVNDEITGIARHMRGSSANIAVLAAINLAEQALRAQETADNLREQIKGCLEEAAKCKSEAAELRRENTRLKKAQ